METDLLQWQEQLQQGSGRSRNKLVAVAGAATTRHWVDPTNSGRRAKRATEEKRRNFEWERFRMGEISNGRDSEWEKKRKGEISNGRDFEWEHREK